MRTRCLLACAAALLATLGAAAQAPATAGTADSTHARVDRSYERLLSAPQVQALLDALRADHARSIEDLRMLTEIEAPPFGEAPRAQAFLARMRALGLADASIDAEGNVVGLRRGVGQAGAARPKLLVSAHLDTVFPAGTDVRVKDRGPGRLAAPGIADNARGLAVLLSWLKVLQDHGVQTEGDLLFVASVGEEELGNLRGMKRIFADHPDIDGMVGLEPLPDGTVVARGTASRRHEAVFTGPGGHSHGAFGRVPSAVHGMGRAIARIGDLQVPDHPRTTFTVGTAGGGTAVNAIAAEARMTVDIRSDEAAALRATEQKILAAIDAAAAEENRRWKVDTLRVGTRLVGERPGGRTPADSVIVEAATRANASLGLRTRLVGASTDANLPMALGVPAIVIGSGGRAGGFHAADEWIDLREAWHGAQAGLATVLGLVGVRGLAPPLLGPGPGRRPVFVPAR